MTEIDHQIAGGTLIVRPRGRLDARVCVELERVIGALFGPSAHHLVLNLQDVTYLSSASLDRPDSGPDSRSGPHGIIEGRNGRLSGLKLEIAFVAAGDFPFEVTGKLLRGINQAVEFAADF